MGLLYAFGGSERVAGPSSGLGLSHRSVCRLIRCVAAGDFGSGVRLGNGRGGDGVYIPGGGASGPGGGGGYVGPSRRC